MLHGLRLTINAPRRLDFRRVSPAISISYGLVTSVTEEEIADLKKNEPLFRHHMDKGHIQKISRETLEEIEDENKRACANEVRNSSGVNETWSNLKRGVDGLPTIEVSDTIVESNEPGASSAASEKKQRDKLREFSANSAAVEKAKRAAKGAKPASAAA